ncbi:hypothetical protein P9112_011275 [Eukaryota sp. TZLM1-RC]
MEDPFPCYELDAADTHWIHSNLLESTPLMAVRGIKLREQNLGERLLILTADSFRLLILKVMKKKRILRQNIHLYDISRLTVTSKTQFRIDLVSDKPSLWYEFDIGANLTPFVSKIIESIYNLSNYSTEPFTQIYAPATITSNILTSYPRDICLIYKAACNKTGCNPDPIVLHQLSSSESSPSQRISLDSRISARRGIERSAALLYITTVYPSIKQLSLEFTGFPAPNPPLIVNPGGSLTKQLEQPNELEMALKFCLGNIKSLESLSLSCVNQDPSFYKGFFSELSHNKECSITLWDFSRSNLSDFGLLSFMAAINGIKSPCVLSFPYCSISNNGIKQFFEGFIDEDLAKSLKVLDLSGNSISNSLTNEAVEVGLRLLTGLIELNLSETKVDVNHLCRAQLPGQRNSLRVLNLARNHMTSSAAQSLADTLMKFSCLTSLDISNTGLTASNSLLIVSALRNPNSTFLPLVKIGDKQFKPKDMPKVLEVLTSDSAIASRVDNATIHNDSDVALSNEKSIKSVFYEKLSLNLPNVSGPLLTSFLLTISSKVVSLKSLELVNTMDFNCVESVEGLVRSFSSMKHLESLSIKGCTKHKLRTALRPIIVELGRLERLASLDISNNHCGDECLRVLSLVLPLLKLKRLRVDQNYPTEVGFSLLSTAIVQTRTENNDEEILADCPPPKNDITWLLNNSKQRSKSLFMTVESYIAEVEEITRKWVVSWKRLRN